MRILFTIYRNNLLNRSIA